MISGSLVTMNPSKTYPAKFRILSKKLVAIPFILPTTPPMIPDPGTLTDSIFFSAAAFFSFCASVLTILLFCELIFLSFALELIRTLLMFVTFSFSCST